MRCLLGCACSSAPAIGLVLKAVVAVVVLEGRVANRVHEGGDHRVRQCTGQRVEDTLTDTRDDEAGRRRHRRKRDPFGGFRHDCVGQHAGDSPVDGRCEVFRQSTRQSLRDFVGDGIDQGLRNQSTRTICTTQTKKPTVTRRHVDAYIRQEAYEHEFLGQVLLLQRVDSRARAPRRG